MKLRRLPITARVPLIVTLFMIAVSVFASERVLSRLIDTQTRQIEALADTYLDGLALALVDAIIREDVWQVFDVLDRSRHRPGEIQPVETVVAGADGFVIASSDPIAVASQVKVPGAILKRCHTDRTMAVAADAARAYVRREVLYENLRIGSIYAALDIAPLLAERRTVLWTLILTNTALTLLLAGAAWLIVARMMRPVRLLTSHLERSHAGHVEPIPEHGRRAASGDYKRPFAAFNRLAAAVAEREALHARLAEEERLASLGRLASGMAHEINNPLGGLFNAIDTLKRHGADAQRAQTTLDLIDRGLRGIRDVVRAALMSYRAERDDRPLQPRGHRGLAAFDLARGTPARRVPSLAQRAGGRRAAARDHRAADSPQPRLERLPGDAARWLGRSLGREHPGRRSCFGSMTRGRECRQSARSNVDGAGRPAGADRPGHGARALDDQPADPGAGGIGSVEAGRRAARGSR